MITLENLLVKFSIVIILFFATLVLIQPGFARDETLPAGSGVGANWAHFLGPNYNGVPVVEDFDPKGIKQAWSKALGPGCSSVTVVDGKLYTMGNVEDRDIVYCLNSATGDTIWTFEYDCEVLANNYEGGTNSTPTVADGRVYTLSRKGQVHCLDAETGDKIWEVSTEKLPPKKGWWGFSDSPVIWGDKVFLNISDKGMALNKETGEIVWSGEAPAVAYASVLPILASDSVLDRPMLVVQTCVKIDMVDPATGESLMGDAPAWATRKANCNAVNPNAYGDSFLFMHAKNGLSKVSYRDGKWVEDWLCAEAIYDKWEWFTFNRQVIYGDHIFILAGRGKKEADRLMCVDLETGKVAWQKPHDFGNLTLAGDKLILLTQNGQLSWGDLSGNEYKETYSSQPLNGGRKSDQDGVYWAHPVLHNGRFYTRSTRGKLTCFEFE